MGQKSADTHSPPVVMQFSQINLWHLGLLLPLLIALISIPASSLLQNANTVRSFEYKGVERSYLLFSTKPQAGQKGQPLVIALHDEGSSAKNLLRITQGRLNKIAEQDGYIVVYPEGVKKQWDIEGKRASESLYSGDIGFIKMLIESLGKEMTLDRDRIFVTGMGAGGLLAFQLACEMPEMFKGVAVVSAAMPKQNIDGCKDVSKTSLLLINGTDNPIVPYRGGMVYMKKQAVDVLSTEETIGHWLKKNSCLYHAKENLLPDEDPRDKTSITQYTYSGCHTDVLVTLYKVAGGGHTWPGGKQYSKQERIGRTTRDIDAGEEILNFFNQH